MLCTIASFLPQEQIRCSLFSNNSESSLSDLYPPKHVINTKLIQKETAMRNTEVHAWFSSAPNLSATDLIPFPLLSSLTSPTLIWRVWALVEQV